MAGTGWPSGRERASRGSTSAANWKHVWSLETKAPPGRKRRTVFGSLVAEGSQIHSAGTGQPAARPHASWPSSRALQSSSLCARGKMTRCIRIPQSCGNALLRVRNGRMNRRSMSISIASCQLCGRRCRWCKGGARGPGADAGIPAARGQPADPAATDPGSEERLPFVVLLT
eukprot:scaffold3278_cov124-Isochrysis_galbana.AAC.3